MGAGQDIPEGGDETGGGVNDDIGDIFGGGVGRGTERGRGRRGGVSGSDRIKWSIMERGGGRMSDHPDRRRAGNKAGRDKVANT